MRKNKGFTLIEVMVVLSILAIIAILAYNFFGSTMKDATISNCAIQAMKNVNAIATAVEIYSVESGQETTTLILDENWSTFLGTGALKTRPTRLPANCRLNDYWDDGVAHVLSGYSYGGTAAFDTAVVMPGVTREVCDKIQQLISGNTAWDWDGLGDNLNNISHCSYWADGGRATGYGTEFILPIFVR